LDLPDEVVGVEKADSIVVVVEGVEEIELVGEGSPFLLVVCAALFAVFLSQE
jgi:hypothetical protein